MANRAARSRALIVVREELGIAYASGATGPPASEPLRLPVAAGRLPDGTTLVVDERSAHKCLPVRAEFRTLRVGADGTVHDDLHAVGIEDGYGCVLDDGRVAVLRVTQWELWVMSRSGERERIIDLARLSKHMPACLAATPAGTFLIAFVDRVFEVDLVEIDATGRLLWYLPAGEVALGCPSSVQLLLDDHLLVVDEFCHVAVELTRSGEVTWTYGAWRDPGRQDGRLSSPRAARATRQGERLIADTRNHRVLAVDADGHARSIPVADDTCSPTFVDRLADGNLLVCDAFNGRVLECDSSGEIVWQFGSTVIRRRSLSFPRSAEPLAGGGVLVCDTANDRVVELHGAGERTRPIADAAPLRWPRCARPTADGGMVVADGLNSRVLEVAPDGRVTRKLTTMRRGGRSVPLGDPHDVRILDGDRLLVTDPSRDMVVEVDWSGRIHRLVGGRPAEGPVELDDPHSAQLLGDGQLLICDTGHHRVLWVGADGEIVDQRHSLRRGPRISRLNRPRYAEIDAGGRLVIVDTGNNRVLVAGTDGDLLCELDAIAGSPLPRLDQPRWARALGRGELLVCDHYQHRVLRLSYATD